MASVSDFLCEWLNDLPYIKAFTSGSTGNPKEIRLLKSDMVCSARATNSFFGINRNSVLGLPLSVDYIAGKMMAVRAQVAGCRLIEFPVSNRFAIDSPVDLLSIVPTQLDVAIRHSQFIRCLLVGGAPLSLSQEEMIVSAGLNAWLGYGMTETCSHVALRKVGGDGVFRAMPGISFTLDSRQCLVVRSEKFSWKTLVTNDVVHLLGPGEFRWLGRFDNVINSGGVKLHPEILEEEYRRVIPSLPPFCLVGEPDDLLGQRLVMIAENPPSSLLDTLRARISDHRIVPSRIISLRTLPRTPSGKILRNLPPTKELS